MPSKNVIRNFTEGGIYHVFNRGVEKRTIFLDEQDYQIFLYYLTVYLKPLKEVIKKYPNLPLRLYGKNLNSEIELLCFCQMPNHFHLLVKQNSSDGISKLLKQISNAYTLYFNQKNKRVGCLFQGRFKAVSIESDEQLLQVSRYIHLNPLAEGLVEDLKYYKWSSYRDYIKGDDLSPCKKKSILFYFRSLFDYQNFVLDQTEYLKSIGRVNSLLIDKEET